MQFKPNYPIYLQVADYVCERVLTKTWRANDKLPSVKELANVMSVNPNTVIKSLSFLIDSEILMTQRGVGYFLTEQAYGKTIALKRKQFVSINLPELFSNMELLGISVEELESLYQEHVEQQLPNPLDHDSGQ